MSSPEAKARKFFGERAEFYATNAIHTETAVLDHLVELAGPEPDWRVLDVATGAGHTALVFAPKVREVVGTDLTLEMLFEARKLREAKAAGNVALCLADAHHLPFGMEEFHLVTSRRAPHHFSQITAALTEMRRVLKRDGMLLIDDRSVPEEDGLDALMNELDRWHDSSHIRQYRPSEWRAMLEGLGFEVVHVELFTRLRPLSALAGGIPEEDALRIVRKIESLDREQGAAIGLQMKDGEWHHYHWYVIVAAFRRDPL